MEMVLSFTDEDHFEVQKFKRAVTADNAYMALWDINQLFRNIVKYNPCDEFTPYQIEIVDKIWGKVNEIINESVDMELYT